MSFQMIGSVIFFMFCSYFMGKGSSLDDEEDEIEFDEEDEEDNNKRKFRTVTMSCQTCRKIKKHKEIKNNLFQCVKCKRHVDLR